MGEFYRKNEEPSVLTIPGNTWAMGELEARQHVHHHRKNGEMRNPRNASKK